MDLARNGGRPFLCKRPFDALVVNSAQLVRLSCSRIQSAAQCHGGMTSCGEPIHMLKCFGKLQGLLPILRHQGGHHNFDGMTKGSCDSGQASHGLSRTRCSRFSRHVGCSHRSQPEHSYGWLLVMRMVEYARGHQEHGGWNELLKPTCWAAQLKSSFLELCQAALKCCSTIQP